MTPATASPRPGSLRIFATHPAVTTTVGMIAIAVVWESAVRALNVPAFILPRPSLVIAKIVSDLTTGVIAVHFRVTLVEVLVGFGIAAVAGVAVGAAIALVPAVERMVYPLVLGLQTIPKVAIAPLLIIWVGYGVQSKVLTAALIAFFPVLVNVMAGVKTVEPRRILLMRALNAGWWTTFKKVRIPSMLPYLFAGLEVAAVFAVIGAIVGEFIGASEGLGSLIIQRQGAIDVAGVFSVLAYLSAMGIALSIVIRIIARRYAFWAHGTEQATP